MRMLRWYDSRGKRPAFSRRKKNMPYFNPRSRMGNDYVYLIVLYCSIYFNPRSRLGNDSDMMFSFKQFFDFNPRSRVGNDDMQSLIHGTDYEFQSTFPRGERQTLTYISAKDTSISIHVPAWGTTPSYQSSCPPYNFNPRSRVGNDKYP